MELHEILREKHISIEFYTQWNSPPKEKKQRPFKEKQTNNPHLQNSGNLLPEDLWYKKH